MYSYDLTFYLAGAGICVSTLMLLVVPLLRRCDVIIGSDKEAVKGVEHSHTKDLNLDLEESDEDEETSRENHVRFTDNA